MSLAKFFLYPLILAVIAGCLGIDAPSSPVGGDSGGGGNDVVGDGTQKAVFTLRNSLQQDLPFEITPPGIPDGSTCIITNKPAWVQFDPIKGTISGTPPDPGLYSAVRIDVIKPDGSAMVVGPFDITVVGDPLTNFAWHLDNTGQKTFARNAGLSGEDLKVRSVIRQGITGAKVRIAVSDTGTEINHPDLAANVIAGASKNYNLPAPFLGDPSPAGTGADHGTSVSGVIAARAWNSIGARGIAPEASIAAFNYLSSSQSQIILVDQASGNFDIYNQSWGTAVRPNSAVVYSKLAAAYRDALKAGVTSGRGGKGAIYVRAAGNDYGLRSFGTPPIVIGRSANSEENNANPYVIVVGALDAKGKKASYSSIGPSIFISGLAGEFGSTDPAILTTDVAGCGRGYAQVTPPLGLRNLFETGMFGNLDCNMTSTFNGTSSASPTIAGVIALLLQVNPNLTWRDVKYILAKTAAQVDPLFQPSQFPADPVGYFSEPGWTTNAAGNKYHNWYGFGRANAQAAVAMARGFVSPLGTFKQTSAADGTYKYSSDSELPINDNDPINPTAVGTLDVTENFTIESVVVELSVTHRYTGDLGVELVSPSGTKSILLHTNNAFNTSNFDNVRFISHAFYGENSSGTWTLRVVDGYVDDQGKVTNWKINVLGY